MCVSSPAPRPAPPPPPPPPPAPAPVPGDETVVAGGDEARRRRAGALSRNRQNILTGAGGVVSAANLGTRSLLGG